MSKFDVKIETKRKGDVFSIAWDYNADSKNRMDGQNNFRNISDASAQWVFEEFKNALSGLPLKPVVAGNDLNVVIKWNDLTEAQFHAVEGICNSVQVKLHAHSCLKIK